MRVLFGLCRIHLGKQIYLKLSRYRDVNMCVLKKYSAFYIYVICIYIYIILYTQILYKEIGCVCGLVRVCFSI